MGSKFRVSGFLSPKSQAAFAHLTRAEVEKFRV